MIVPIPAYTRFIVLLAGKKAAIRPNSTKQTRTAMRTPGVEVNI